MQQCFVIVGGESLGTRLPCVSDSGSLVGSHRKKKAFHKYSEVATMLKRNVIPIKYRCKGMWERCT